MKSLLLASSALVTAVALAPAAQAEDGKINLSVFTQFHASSTDADNETLGTNNGHDFNTNSEIKLTASNTADNGLRYGLEIQLETDQDSTENTDENYIWLEGDFGRVELGDQDGADDGLLVSGKDVGLLYGMIDNATGSTLDTGSASVAATAADISDSSDATKITYYTPSFNGFKAGVSYVPDSSDGAEVANRIVDTRAEQTIEAGLNYSGSFNDVSLEVGASSVWSDHSGDAGTAQNDAQLFGAGVGFNVGYAGFTVGAGYTYQDGDGVYDNQNTVDAGINYTAGPWQFAVAGVWSEINDVTASSGNDFESTAVSAGIQYEVAPGLAVYGSAIAGDYEGGAEEFTSVQSGVLVSF